MGIMNLFKKDKSEERLEIDLDKTVVPLGEGKGDASLSELVNSFNKTHPEAPKGLSDDDLVEVRPGLKVKVSELKNAHLGLMNKEDEEKSKEEHKNGLHKSSMKNCAMCNAADEEEKKKKEDAEKKNAAEEEEKKKKEEKEEEKKNSIEAQKNADRLEELRNAGKKLEMPKIQTLQDLVAEGAARYGDLPVTITK